MPEVLEFLSQWWPAILAYIVGATPFGFLAGKMKGIDIRDHGSGNIGATNVLRTLGKPIGITVLVLDIFKGMIPVIIAKLVSEDSALHIATAIAAILGHNYTFWLRFKGGKGIATTAGAVIPILTIPILAAAAGWGIALKITRYVSVASIVAAIVIPVTLSIQNFISGEWDWIVFSLALFVCLLAIWKHRGNIQRLRAGKENRFEPKSSQTESS
ncbi:MAG: glycerol-3-phosphate 1-O-acyltransferase PlsY [Verrucomicrobiota bacterium]